MLELGWTEIMLIAGVAVLVISPKDLPRAMRTAGQWVGQVKRMARGFQSQVDKAIREADLEDVRKDVQSVTKYDPLGDVRKEMRKVDDDIRRDMKDTGTKAAATTGDKPAPAAAAKAPAAAPATTTAAKAPAAAPAPATGDKAPAVPSAKGASGEGAKA